MLARCQQETVSHSCAALSLPCDCASAVHGAIQGNPKGISVDLCSPAAVGLDTAGRDAADLSSFTADCVSSFGFFCFNSSTFRKWCLTMWPSVCRLSLCTEGDAAPASSLYRHPSAHIERHYTKLWPACALMIILMLFFRSQGLGFVW